MHIYSINKEEWDKALDNLLLSYDIFASVNTEWGQDYELIRPEDICRISYNIPKPATSLKSFFLPVKENVTSERKAVKPRIIMGIPNCDIEGLSLLDEIYLDKDFQDIFYRERREDTVLISSDCFGKSEHCHCINYDIRPYATRIADVAVAFIKDVIILRMITDKGEDLVKKIPSAKNPEDENISDELDKIHKNTEALFRSSRHPVPEYGMAGKMISNASDRLWKKFSSRCVSCGACAAICPTCTCFLLIDKPGFEKIKLMDSCQYPGFERVAGGEDALFALEDRFRNRYMCKYVWKPEKFSSGACTGCGRCIEACIGKINKNELIAELAK